MLADLTEGELCIISMLMFGIYLYFINDQIDNDCNPILLQIQWGACGLVLAGNVVVFLTILGYFFVFGNDDLDYSSW